VTYYPSLTRTQNNILDFIEEFIGLNRGLSPTSREIQAGCEISSTSVVAYNIEILANKGYIELTRGIARGISLPPKEETNSRVGQLQGAIREALGLIKENHRYNAAVSVLEKALEE
jgi:SOS-response transcriptional repressor LexA